MKAARGRLHFGSGALVLTERFSRSVSTALFHGPTYSRVFLIRCHVPPHERKGSSSIRRMKRLPEWLTHHSLQMGTTVKTDVIRKFRTGYKLAKRDRIKTRMTKAKSKFYLLRWHYHYHLVSLIKLPKSASAQSYQRLCDAYWSPQVQFTVRAVYIAMYNASQSTEIIPEGYAVHSIREK